MENIVLEKINFVNGSAGKTPLNSNNMNAIQQNTENAINEVVPIITGIEENTENNNSDIAEAKINIANNTNNILEINNFIKNSMKTLSEEGTSIHVNDSADYVCNLRVEGKSEQVQEENYPEITMTLDSESGNYYLDGITTQNGTPSPDNMVDFVNTYPAGTYQTIINDKTYVITLNDDLRSITKGTTTADRLWLDITNAKAWIDKKVYITVFDNPQGWNQFKENVYTCTWSIPDYGIDITKHSSFARCNYFEEILNSELGTNIGMYTLNSAYLKVSYPGKTLEEFKEWITEKNETGKPLMAIFTLRYPVENLIDQNCYEWNVPSPNNKIDIENVSGDLKVKAIAKNLFNINDENIGKVNCSEVLIEGNSITITSINSATTSRVDFPVNYPVNKPLEISFDATIISQDLLSENVVRIYFRKDSQTYGTIELTKNNLKNHYSSKINAIPEKDIKLWLYVKSVAKQGTIKVKFENIQIEVGETATEFEEYKEQTVTFPLGEQKLMKDGYLADNGIHNKRKQIVLDGTETIEKGGVISIDIGNGALTWSEDVLSNYFKSPGIIVGNNGNIWIYYGTNRYPEFADYTAEEFKSWLAEKYNSGNRVIIEYPLAEEETTPYTTEQQTAYNTLQKFKTYRTTTNISNSQDTNMQLTYKMDLQTQIQGGGSSA